MSVEVARLDPQRVDELRELWLSLLEHHGSVARTMPPTREPEGSWRRRRADYVAWLSTPPSFVLTAVDHGQFVGYALVRVGEGDETWDTGDRHAELETLAVAPAARGNGVGGALMDAVEAELARLGVRDLFLGVVAANERARSFYERRGLAPYLLKLHRRL